MTNDVFREPKVSTALGANRCCPPMLEYFFIIARIRRLCIAGDFRDIGLSQGHAGDTSEHYDLTQSSVIGRVSHHQVCPICVEEHGWLLRHGIQGRSRNEV